MSESPPRLLNHLRVKVERMNFPRPEPLEDDFGSDTATAPHFEDARAFDAPAQTLQKMGLVPSLDERAHRVIHQRFLDAIEFQDGSPSVTKLLFRS